MLYCQSNFHASVLYTRYLAERVKLFDDLYAIQEAELAAKAEAESKPIKITLPDGKVVEGSLKFSNTIFSARCIYSVMNSWAPAAAYILVYNFCRSIMENHTTRGCARH